MIKLFWNPVLKFRWRTVQSHPIFQIYWKLLGWIRTLGKKCHFHKSPQFISSNQCLTDFIKDQRLLKDNVRSRLWTKLSKHASLHQRWGPKLHPLRGRGSKSTLPQAHSMSLTKQNQQRMRLELESHLIPQRDKWSWTNRWTTLVR